MADRDPDGARLERFSPIRQIATGGMGRVSEAFDRYLERTVAIKESVDTDPARAARFRREVAITARLEHPSIIPIYDAGMNDEGRPFYVMRRVAGQRFDLVLEVRKTLAERLMFLPNLLAMTEAVAHAHRRGVIHRDLKPANVLVGELGETIVIDWGLAKVTEDDGPWSAAEAPGLHDTAPGLVIGTRGFMAPEQADAGSVDARADVYSLGACLYQMLAGTPPPGVRGGPAGTARPRARRLPPGVPAELSSIAAKAMALDPDDRYEDAGGFGEDLRRFLTGQLIAAHRYSALERFGHWLLRRAVAVTRRSRWLGWMCLRCAKPFTSGAGPRSWRSRRGPSS